MTDTYVEDSTKKPANEAGTEYSSHMTNDAKPGSHSALFGLEPQNKPTQNAGRGPGSGIEGTSGHGGIKNVDPQPVDAGVGGQQVDTKTGGMAEGSQSSGKSPMLLVVHAIVSCYQRPTTV